MSAATEIVIVSGLPRSGTSLVMQMLAAGGLALLADDARPPDPDNPRGYLEYASVRRLRSDATWLAAARGRALKVVAPLVQDLPPGERYRVLLVRREIAEVMASQRAMLARRGAPASPLAEERSLAARFAAAVAATERWLEAQPHVAWCALAHAELLGDPAAASRRIAAFLPSARLDAEAMAAVVDPALHRQRAGARPGGLS